MSHPIRLRGGDLIRPEEFPKDHLTPMHVALDALDTRTPAEKRRDRGNDRFMRIVSKPIVSVPLSLIAAAIVGFGLANGPIR